MIHCLYHQDSEGKYICFSALCKDRYSILCDECIQNENHENHKYCLIQELFDKIKAQRDIKRMKNDELLKEIIDSGNNLCERIQEQITKLTELKTQMSKSISTIVNHFTVHLDIDTGLEDDNPASKCTTNEEVINYLSNIIDFSSFSFDFQIDSKQNFLGVQLNNIKNLFSSERFQFYKYPLEDLKERISEVRKYCNQINQSQSEFEICLRKKSAGSKTQSSMNSQSNKISNKNDTSHQNSNGYPSNNHPISKQVKKEKQLIHSDHNLYSHKTRKLSILLKDSLFGNPHLHHHHQNSPEQNQNNSFHSTNDAANHHHKQINNSQLAMLKVSDNLDYQNILSVFLQDLENEQIESVKILIYQDKETISTSDISKILKKLQNKSASLETLELQASTKVLKMFDSEKLGSWLNKNCQKSLKAIDLRLVFTKTNDYENYLNILHQLQLSQLREIHLNYILSSINKYDKFFQNHPQLTHLNLDILYSLPSQVEEFFEDFFLKQIKSHSITSLYLNFNVKNNQKSTEYLSSFSLDCSYLTYLQSFMKSQKDSLHVFQISDNVRFNSSLPLEESIFEDDLIMPQLSSIKIQFNMIDQVDAKKLLQKIELNLPQIQECHLFPEFDTLFENLYVKRLKIYQERKMIKVLAILKWKFISFSTDAIHDIFQFVFNSDLIFQSGTQEIMNKLSSDKNNKNA